MRRTRETKKRGHGRVATTQEEKEEVIPLTRDFKDTVKDRVDRDPEFRQGLLTEAMDAVVRGEPDVAKLLLRDYINAMESFEAVGKAVEKSPKSLMRMLSRQGNPNVNNLLGLMRYLQEQAGVRFKVVPIGEKHAKRNELVH